MRLSIFHRTRYAYSAPVPQSFNEVRMHPLTDPHQTCSAFGLSIAPAAPFRRRLDFFSNWVHSFEIGIPHAELVVEARSEVETHPPPLDPARLADTPDDIDPSAEDDLFEFLGSSPSIALDETIWRLAVDARSGARTIWETVLAMGRILRREFAYAPASTTVRSSAAEFFRDRRGVCQDFAHGMIALCRSAGIPARYVSGYLYTGTGENAGGSVPEATHAWCDIYLPSAGWTGFDPTHGRPVGEEHVRLAVGRDYTDVPPLRGSYRGNADAELSVEVHVRRADAPGRAIPQTA
jgi:transglutaminase-like putative cysteine protease